MVHLGYTILYVPNVVAAIEFYEKAFGLKRKFIAGNDYGELDTGATTLSFASMDMSLGNIPGGVRQSSLKEKPAAFEIAFVTDDVEKTFKDAVKAGARPEAEATLKPHGQTVAYVRDPDGVLIEICSPVVN